MYHGTNVRQDDKEERRPKDGRDKATAGIARRHVVEICTARCDEEDVCQKIDETEKEGHYIGVQG